MVALLVATDPAAVEDVKTFCREGGHELLSTEREGKVLRFRIRKGGKGGQTTVSRSRESPRS
jgi:TusA-related sulfurtransferase